MPIRTKPSRRHPDNYLIESRMRPSKIEFYRIHALDSDKAWTPIALKRTDKFFKTDRHLTAIKAYIRLEFWLGQHQARLMQYRIVPEAR
jgi:hypothetical protein